MHLRFMTILNCFCCLVDVSNFNITFHHRS